MKKISIFILTLCMLLIATACNAKKNNENISVTTSQTESMSENEEISELDETVQNEQTELKILKFNKRNFYQSEWSEEDQIVLAECEFFEILLEEDERKLYPKLDKVLSENMSLEESNIKEEFINLTEMAKEKFSEDKDNFKTFVSEIDKKVRRADNIAVSILNDSYYYNGMGEGTRGFWGENFDTETGKELYIPDVVTDIDEFVKVVENKLFNSVGEEVLLREDIIREYFEMYGKDGTHWTLDYNGVTIYFDEGEIAGEGLGVISVTITFLEYPELFNEKYMIVPDEYIVSLSTKTAFYKDLDGDKICEELNIYDNYDEENEYSAIIDIYTTKDSYTENLWAYDCEPYYIKTTNHRHYIYLFTELETQMYLYVYDITGKKISKVGEVNVTPFYNDGMTEILTDPNSMHFEIFSDEAGGGVSEGNDLFSVGVDGIPAQG